MDCNHPRLIEGLISSAATDAHNCALCQHSVRTALCYHDDGLPYPYSEPLDPDSAGWVPRVVPGHYSLPGFAADISGFRVPKNPNPDDIVKMREKVERVERELKAAKEEFLRLNIADWSTARVEALLELLERAEKAVTDAVLQFHEMRLRRGCRCCNPTIRQEVSATLGSMKNDGFQGMAEKNFGQGEDEPLKFISLGQGFLLSSTPHSWV